MIKHEKIIDFFHLLLLYIYNYYMVEKKYSKQLGETCKSPY